MTPEIVLGLKIPSGNSVGLLSDLGREYTIFLDRYVVLFSFISGDRSPHR